MTSQGSTGVAQLNSDFILANIMTSLLQTRNTDLWITNDISIAQLVGKMQSRALFPALERVSLNVPGKLNTFFILYTVIPDVREVMVYRKQALMLDRQIQVLILPGFGNLLYGLECGPIIPGFRICLRYSVCDQKSLCFI